MERATKQRRAIVQAMLAAARPLSREELLTEARRLLPGLGVATVNRAIRHMTGEGQLVGVSFPGQPTRYELPAPREHLHFICQECRRVFDWEAPIPDIEIKPPQGFSMAGYEVMVFGRCPECSGGS
jgi:Fur family transcriptional regulator, ferric uptake regulator